MTMKTEHADVLIVGAGASGAVAALRLAEAGFSVVALEQGDWPDRDSFRGAHADWEFNLRKQWSPFPEIRGNAADYPIEQSECDIGLMNWNGVGGATLLWGAVWPRFRPADFRVRSEDGVADDWPLSYAELAPYYARAEQQFGVSGLPGDPMYPEGTDYPMPPLPLNEGGHRVARAQSRLGWHWWPHPCAINSTERDGRHACVQRGTCLSGCNEGAKASTDLTHWPKFLKAGGRLVTGARVSRITTDGKGRANGAEWLDAEGRAHHQPADVVLVAANGIGTPRLLLMSADGAHPQGLCNSSGLVGRNLMLHPTRRVLGYFEDSIGGWQGPNGGAMICMEFVATDKSRGFVRGAKWTLGPLNGPLGTALMANVWGRRHHEHLRERFGRGMGWNIMAEDLPRETNRVTLASGLADGHGLPVPKVAYRVDDNSKRILDFNEVRARRSLVEAGAKLTELQPGLVNAHFMGTARMGDDPGRSVVDRWGMAHDIPNLGIIDGSVFVTASSSNPTPTIAALALRTADHLVANRSRIPAPDRSIAVAVRPPAAVAKAPAPAPELAFSSAERERLAQLADALIPADGECRSAVQAGVAGALLDKVLALRPDLAAPLHRLLAEPFSQPSKRLAELAATQPPHHAALQLAVAGAYYYEPAVRQRIGYPGQEARPFNPRQFEAFVTEGLLDHVTQRPHAA